MRTPAQPCKTTRIHVQDYANHDQAPNNTRLAIDKSAHETQVEACEKSQTAHKTYTHVMWHSCYQIDGGNKMCTEKYIFPYKQQNTIQPQGNGELT